MPNYSITQIANLDPIACPCGKARRAFVAEAESPASLHEVDITENARTHFHKTMTEFYYVIEGNGFVELDGDRHAVRPGDAVLIRPGCRHRAVSEPGKPLKILNVCVPAFDPADEWFD
ncbi:cupin domain-containing protein [Adhaeretor mobilis]|uniref:Cupin domain protein n=1 Tax=Adhaeretor mobilis TaxID=1930276 RepID=A0A517N110_9BACT|nr:cupin domain-containing protein [Adhaeretor mobilis]QDT00832.1 Cupin domain protein [Adhaeretor mobilis]